MALNNKYMDLEVAKRDALCNITVIGKCNYRHYLVKNNMPNGYNGYLI